MSECGGFVEVQRTQTQTKIQQTVGFNFSNPSPQINKGQRKPKSEIHKDQQQKNIQKTHQTTLERHHYICMQWRKLEQTKCRLIGQTGEINQEKIRKVKQRQRQGNTEV